MKRLKRVVAVLVAIALVACFIQIPEIKSFASDEYFLVQVTKDNAPLRTGPTNKDEIVARTYQGRILVVKSALTNSKGNLWYEIGWEDDLGDGKTLYIYSGNVKVHMKHDYHKKSISGINFKYCDCGKVYFEDTSNFGVSYNSTGNKLAPAVYSNVNEQKIREKILSEHCDNKYLFQNDYTVDNVLSAAAPYYSFAGVLSLADGPLPIGDMVAVVVVVVSLAMISDVEVPDTAIEVVEDIEAAEYLLKNSAVCTDTNYRMVKRVGKKLVQINDKCIPLPLAYIYTRYAGGDVWTPDATGAKALEVVSLSDIGYFGPEVDKNKTGYYYHYHYGTSHEDKKGGHVFFGTGVGNDCIPE